jgi:hypothetical protein
LGGTGVGIPAVTENKKGRHRAENGSIGHVEYGPEGIKLPAENGNPFGQKSFPDIHINHIHHLAVKPGAGATLGRVAQKDTIENRIEKISGGPTQNKGHAGNVCRPDCLPYEDNHIPGDGSHGQDPEGGKQQLSVIASKFHPEGHSRVKGIMQFEPVIHQRYLPGKSALHRKVGNELNGLVEGEHQPAYAEIAEKKIFHCRSEKLSYDVFNGMAFGFGPEIAHNTMPENLGGYGLDVFNIRGELTGHKGMALAGEHERL